MWGLTSKMLKKSPFSPARPRRAETRLFPCGVLETREAYLVKRRSFRILTFHASRFTNDEDGFFVQSAR